MYHFINALLPTDIFSNDFSVGKLVDRLKTDSMLQMLIALVVMIIAAAVIVAVMSTKKEASNEEPEPESPGAGDDASRAEPGGGEGLINKKPEAYTKRRATSKVETFYIYSAPVHVRMCPYCGCENNVMDERCGCCGEYLSDSLRSGPAVNGK